MICLLYGLLAIFLVLGALHLWVRLWNRVASGDWSFHDDIADAVDAHFFVMPFSLVVAIVLAAVLAGAYELGCLIQGYLPK